ncbi:hypothetical protein P168DRAFT_323508 [Aspergillus campestris IBT 28561]|uniref:Uncharacterized protein n=1 Tax=Aspergillus campestris (strain IBT 28561) TaxID=1392248 RepID=A0A2I1DER6_ASPC2|nr:uncharacterized protein P168DRAFT_323508 [Aspergillus campestris IBT 28561]PKY08364.1 hypothetical protein P168DRAFT_323508 [Aspergillus campestris IBT 28561]
MPPENLYGLPRTATKADSDKNKNKTNTPSSSTLAFTTKLSSLISSPSQSQSNQHTTGRPRPRPRTTNKDDKDDIFARPNRGTAERAAADEHGLNERGKKRSALEQVHSTDSGVVDEALLERSKRRLREKEGLYEILKEGRHLVYSDDEDDSSGQDEGEGNGNDGERKKRRELRRLARKEREGLVDFDAKWARSTSPSSSKGSSSSKAQEEEEEEEEEEEDDDNASIISYEDELGRTRRGTRKQASRAAAATIASTKSNPSHPDERWKPAQPANLIHGSTIQTQAFDPDAPTASHMARLAARRDRSATPPEETHYDAGGEVRARGTGFYAFSRDEGVRRGQMEELMKGREETERGREERKARRERRGVRREERGRKIEELRGRRRAEVFLEGLG